MARDHGHADSGDPSGSGRAGRFSVRRALWLVALLCWVGFVWGHSLVPGEASDADSMAYVARLSPLFGALGVTGAHLMDVIVRKSGHFLEYAVLGVIADGAPSRVASVLICVVVPCVDETIQLFVPGRSGMVTDVCLDMFGCAVGLGLLALARRAVTRRG